MLLIAAAFIEDAAAGDPTGLGEQQAGWVGRAMSESDMESLLAMRGERLGSAS